MRLRRWRLLKCLFVIVILIYSFIILSSKLPEISFDFRTNSGVYIQYCNKNSNSISHMIIDQRWISIGKLMYTSALYVNTGTPYVQVIGIKKRKEPIYGSIYCQMWYNQSGNITRVVSVAASVRNMPEDRGKKYSGAFINCMVPRNIKPFALSLMRKQCSTAENILPVILNMNQTKQFTVCVTPLNYKYSRAYELVEMIELNQILGADLFVFYNYSTQWNVNKILKYYQKRGLAEVVQWHLPVKVNTWPKKQEPEIHYFGQLPALNDCLYRNMHRSAYLVFQDLDEFIIPRKSYSWKEMIEKLPERNGIYMFRNAFFRKDWPNKNMSFFRRDLALKYKTMTLLKLKREKKIQDNFQRSKYIVNPRLVEIVGVHNLYSLKSGNSVYFVETDLALLHHYRDWENPNDYDKGKEDAIALKYSNDLLKRLHKIWRNLTDIPLGPLS